MDQHSTTFIPELVLQLTLKSVDVEHAAISPSRLDTLGFRVVLKPTLHQELNGNTVAVEHVVEG